MSSMPRFSRSQQVVIDLARAQHDAADLGRRASLIASLSVGAIWASSHSTRWKVVPVAISASADTAACGAAATSASSGSAACGSRASSGGAGCGSSWPASCSWRPACCPRRTSAGSARGGPRSAPAPALHSRAAAADEARHAQPLAFARRDELVEHDLRAVGEVAELRFPHRQRVGLGQRVAVFEAEHRLFRQHRVDDLELARLVRRGCC
jgi:hypothetical protein